MPTVVIKQEVEATPALIIGELKKFAASMQDERFPYKAGQLVVLKPGYLSLVQGIEGMPGLVIASTKGTPLGMIAIHKPDGLITLVYINADQVESVYEG